MNVGTNLASLLGLSAAGRAFPVYTLERLDAADAPDRPGEGPASARPARLPAGASVLTPSEMTRPEESAGRPSGPSPETVRGLRARLIRFKVDADTGEIRALVVDPDTRNVIRQIPPAELQAFLWRYREFVGLFVDEEV